jgi:hypothetical protein
MSATAPEIVRQSDTSQRLIGWLVSYAQNEQGKAHELRSGRYVFGSQRGQDERTITIEENSISTPLAALNALQAHRIIVQDIFSKGGSFLTKANTVQELPITGPVEVGHGDWIRFGDKTRYQVCLIDGPTK